MNLDQISKKYADEVPLPFMSPDLSKIILDLIAKAYKDGAERHGNVWYYVKDGDLPKKDCETVTLHENGNKNIIKWRNGEWTNAIVIPVIAWYEIIKFEQEDMND